MKKNLKHKGFIQIFPLLIFLIPIIILAIAGIFGKYIINTQLNILKDSLDFSNLAVYKNINKDELAKTGTLVFDETELTNALSTFKEYLIKNMDLGPNLEVIRETFITDNINILDLRIYNVQDGKTTEYVLSSSGSFVKTKDNVAEPVITPNAKLVKYTSIYSKINVRLKMFIKVSGHEIKDAPITSYTDLVN